MIQAIANQIPSFIFITTMISIIGVVMFLNVISYVGM